jgi:hypothetical protein
MIKKKGKGERKNNGRTGGKEDQINKEWNGIGKERRRVVVVDCHEDLITNKMHKWTDSFFFSSSTNQSVFVYLSLSTSDYKNS